MTKKERKHAQLEFMGNVSPVFEDFLTIFQNSCQQVHLLYYMSECLRKLMGRFLKRDADEKTFESDLVSIHCSANSQLPDADITIGEATEKALAQIKPDRRKSVYLGIRTFCSTSVTYQHSHLPLQNTLLKH